MAWSEFQPSPQPPPDLSQGPVSKSEIGPSPQIPSPHRAQGCTAWLWGQASGPRMLLGSGLGAALCIRLDTDPLHKLIFRHLDHV